MNGPALLSLVMAVVVVLALLVTISERTRAMARRATRKAARAEVIAGSARRVARQAHARLDARGYPDMPGGGHAATQPIAAVRQLPRGITRHPMRAASAAAVLLGLFVVAPLLMSPSDTDAAPPYEPVPPRPAPSLDDPPTPDLPDGAEPVAVAPPSTITITVTETAVEIRAPSTSSRQAPTSGAPPGTGPPTTTTPPAAPAAGDEPPCSTPLPVPPPTGCVITPQIGP